MSMQILPPDPTIGGQITEGVNTGLQTLIKRFSEIQQGKKLAEVLGLEGEQAKAFSKINPNMQQLFTKDILQEKKEEATATRKSQISPEMKQRMSRALENQLNLLKTGDIGLGKYHKILTEKGRENRAEFNTYRASVESVLLPLLNKGVLSKPRFDFILSNIPNANDTIGKIKGKIKALNNEFGLNIEIPDQIVNETIKKEGKRMVTMIAPDGSTAQVPYNSDIMKKALKAGAKVVRGK